MLYYFFQIFQLLSFYGNFDDEFYSNYHYTVIYFHIVVIASMFNIFSLFYLYFTIIIILLLLFLEL